MGFRASIPTPWRYHVHPVGGLWAVGFGPGSDLLLVLSVSGRGVFDCLSGERIARDPEEDEYEDHYDETAETVLGIGPLAGVRVPVCGTGGGVDTQRTLPVSSTDGWSMALLPSRNRGNECVALRAPSSEKSITLIDAEEPRAFGFSPTGRCLIVAEPHTLHVWSR